MEKKCEICGKTCTIKPAGVAKATGKPYNAFYACSSGEKHYQTERPFKTSPDAFKSPTSGFQTKDDVLTKEHFDTRMDALAKFLMESMGSE